MSTNRIGPPRAPLPHHGDCPASCPDTTAHVQTPLSESPAAPECAHLATCPACRPLTPRQLDVVTLAAEGLTKAEIGQRLWLTENTVRSHAQAAVKAAGVRGGLTAVVALALRRGWIT